MLSLATVSYISGLRVSDDNSARVEATNDAAAALEAVGRGLRTAVTGPNGAPAFNEATRTTVDFASTLYASCDQPSTVRYFTKPDGTLIEQITPSGGVMRQRILAHGIAGTNLFAFFRARSDPADPTKQQLAEIGPVPVTAGDLGAIRVVETSIAVRARDRANAPTVTAQTRTFLVNANNGGSGC